MKKLIEFIENYSVLLVGIMFFLLGMFACDKIRENTGDGTTETTIEHSRDTVKVHTTDTVTQYRTITKKAKPDTVIKYRKPSKDHHTVQTEYKDDTLDLTVNTQLEGEYLDQNINYELNYPQRTITKTDSILITDSTTTINKIKKPDRWKVGLGLNVQGNRNQFDFGPELSLERNRWDVGYGYNVVNKTHRVIVRRKFPITQ